jgi:uncharacterized protein YlxW (UPF0749 family)
MTEEHRDSGTGWPEPTGPSQPSGPAAEPDPRPDAPPADGVSPLLGDAREPGATDVGGGADADAGAAGPEPGAGDDTVPLPAGGADADPGADPEPEPADPDPGVDVEPADVRDAGRVDAAGPAGAGDGPTGSVWKRLGLTRPKPSGAGAMIGVLLALLGFTLAVQLKTSSADPTLAATRQEDLVRILSDLESQEERLRQDVTGLEDSQRQLTSGSQARQAALDEATRRADELGILAGTLPARGTGLTVTFSASSSQVRASTILDAVQELRGAGAEAMQISDRDDAAVRVIASTYFLDDDNAIAVSGRRMVGPYTITVIGDPTTMRTALNIPGGVVASVNQDGGNVIVQERDVVDVKALSAPTNLKHARPVS